MSRRRWIDPQDFRDLRKQSGLTRREAAEALNVTPRTIQNWETGGARIPWMAYRMLRILRGYALPGCHWEGWTLQGDKLYPPAGHPFEAGNLLHLGLVFGQARLWRQMYARSGRAKTASTVVDFHTMTDEQKPASVIPPRPFSYGRSVTDEKSFSEPLPKGSQPASVPWLMRSAAYVPVSFVAKDWNVTARRIAPCLLPGVLPGGCRITATGKSSFPTCSFLAPGGQA